MRDVEAIQQWIDAVLDAVQEMIQAGDVLSDELMGMVADAIEDAYREIADIEGQGQGAPPIPPPDLEPGDHPSSNISRFKYDPKTQDLTIQFLGKHPNPNGPVYKYGGVPQNTFNLFRRGAIAPRTSGENAWHRWEQGKAPSLGASAYALIREGGYPYQRLQ